MSRQAVAILDKFPDRLDTHGRPLPGLPYLFGRGGRTPFSGWSISKKRLDQRIARSRAEHRLGHQLKAGEEPEGAEDFLEPWTLHDLRRSLVTHMADREELGIDPHIIEAVVGHASGHKGGIAGTYNRAGYREQKKTALQRWADWLEAGGHRHEASEQGLGAGKLTGMPYKRTGRRPGRPKAPLDGRMRRALVFEAKAFDPDRRPWPSRAKVKAVAAPGHTGGWHAVERRPMAFQRAPGLDQRSGALVPLGVIAQIGADQVGDGEHVGSSLPRLPPLHGGIAPGARSIDHLSGLAPGVVKPDRCDRPHGQSLPLAVRCRVPDHERRPARALDANR